MIESKPGKQNLELMQRMNQRDTNREPESIRVGHSPDPDDAFMFYALARGLIETGPYRFEHEMADIETLNRRALQGELEVSAISIHAYPFVQDKYALLSCGCSMGDGYGPMVVARRPMRVEELRGARIAVPGERTTAFLALRLCLGGGGSAGGAGQASLAGGSSAKALAVPMSHRDQWHPSDARRDAAGKADDCRFSYEVVMFDEIPERVAAGEFDAGLIIHEAQLTYQRLGLHKVVDLAEWWGRETGLPLPLGGNVIRRDLGRERMEEVARLLKASIEYGLAHREEALAYALQFGRGLDEALADRFVGMYVNKWTLDYGERGRAAVRALLARAHVAGLAPHCGGLEFVGE